MRKTLLAALLLLLPAFVIAGYTDVQRGTVMQKSTATLTDTMMFRGNFALGQDTFTVKAADLTKNIVLYGTGTVRATTIEGNGSRLTNVQVAASNVQAGTLPATVIASSVATAAVGVPQVNATGSPSASTFLRGDGSWSTPTASDIYSTTATFTAQQTMGTVIISSANITEPLNTQGRTWQVVYTTSVVTSTNSITVTGIHGRSSRLLRISGTYISGAYGATGVNYYIQFGSNTVDTGSNYARHTNGASNATHDSNASALTNLGIVHAACNTSGYKWTSFKGQIHVPANGTPRSYLGEFGDISGGDAATTYAMYSVFGTWRCSDASAAQDINIIRFTASTATGIAAGSEIIIEELR